MLAILRRCRVVRVLARGDRRAAALPAASKLLAREARNRAIASRTEDASGVGGGGWESPILQRRSSRRAALESSAGLARLSRIADAAVELVSFVDTVSLSQRGSERYREKHGTPDMYCLKRLLCYFTIAARGDCETSRPPLVRSSGNETIPAEMSLVPRLNQVRYKRTPAVPLFALLRWKLPTWKASPFLSGGPEDGERRYRAGREQNATPDLATPFTSRGQRHGVEAAASLRRAPA